MSPKVTEEHRESKRQEIVEAALRVFIRQGYLATTMKDVVEESGLSRGGVYLYFSSTEEMFRAMVEEIDQANARQDEELLSAYPTVWEAIAAMFALLRKELLRIREGVVPVLIEAFAAEWRKDSFRDLLERRYAEGCVQLERMLQTGVDRGEFRPRIPIRTIAKMFSSIQGGIMVDTTQFGAAGTEAPEQIEGYLLSLRYLIGVREEGDPA
ncbi:TetR/AcrR family transcriptional regulator [Cohnella sp. REN36]|uniref:TetR/AcrR family transcriptional regulator n=1 Tax=Cohnella sp. REN36 TaxID=2887347 RepID=UPI001D157072|nr:TetR family transcriptional regulator [Cohnella sp. REN36]MCC3374705.1 TetR family transcriptional regulator [Cohnella sp. REN36]